ncbi:adenosine deaminase 2-like [Scaptodrosophila lebanonensis]|uniref:Adenosine deaminase n=1 Tax=Drosophila lebanonensis TaxID=7225 RepID=A0A6J2T7V1_DROLE|nr:adenosine deaminase 2-like [Scaptodrosophila lebanonensis]
MCQAVNRKRQYLHRRLINWTIGNHIMSQLIPFVVLFCWSLSAKAAAEARLSFEQARQAVLNAEEELMTGGHTFLNDQESKVDDLFMQYKLGELSQGFRNAEQNAAALHFFKAKQLIDRSSVFRFLQQMPKGALLHLHNTAAVSSRWVVQNMSYMQGLLRCTNAAGLSILSFRRLPKQHGCQSQYVLVSDERRNSIDPALYDQNFERLTNLYTPVPEFEYPTITAVWNKFQDMFTTLGDALCYLPVFRAYHWQLLEELYNDNVMYVEIRTSLKELYDASGRTFPKEQTVRELAAIDEKFRRLHPNFLGMKIINAVFRATSLEEIQNRIQYFRQLHQQFPNFVVGFDLVGQEDKGKPLYSFLPALQDLPPTARFFFHAGETNWFGASTDINLLDALLLNTTRIGHGYALAKHPILMNAVKTRDIAVEVSPISNQVLHLVWDMRNHPGAQYLALNVPIVICNDDPGFWNAKGLSYDFYYAIMSLAPNNAGLRLLKTLVWNSVRYSLLEEGERRRAYELLEKSWSRFIDKVLQGSVF